MSWRSVTTVENMGFLGFTWVDAQDLIIEHTQIYSSDSDLFTANFKKKNYVHISKLIPTARVYLIVSCNIYE